MGKAIESATARRGSGGSFAALAGTGIVLVALGLYPALPSLDSEIGAEPTRIAVTSIAVPALKIREPEPAAPSVEPELKPAIEMASLGEPLITGSIAPSTAASIAPVSTGSEEFKAAVALLDSKDFVDAFEAAAALPDPVERRTVQWAAIYNGSGAIGYRAVQAFAAEAPAFLSDEVLRTRLEQAIVRARPDTSEVIKLLGGDMPDTVWAQIVLAQAYLDAGQKTKAAKLARAIWVDNFLDAKTETRVLNSFGELLSRQDHWARAVHLMMNDRTTAVSRLVKFLSPAQKSLVTARTAVAKHTKKAKSLLDKVDPAMQDDPVFIYSRVQRAIDAGQYHTAVEWLDKLKGTPPDAELWWYERRTLVRQLLANGEAKLAYAAAAGYTDGPEGRLVEAHFHAGWIALSFLDDAKSAKTHFEAMRQYSTLPESVTQANYWLGRALRKLGEDDAATAAFTAAAEHGTVYYGLLARTELGLTGAGLRTMPEWRDSEPAFEANDVVKAVRLLAANGMDTLAQRLLNSFAEHLDSGPQLLLAARLAQTLDGHHLAISIAELAEKKGFPLDLLSFPKDGLPQTALAAIDKAAIFAITRQESRFNTDAVSGAGAMGLMQLMPGTAKETAAKVGLEYSRSRLTSDPAYNALLGSTYLAGQLERYEGSLLLAAAAYNAGAGNANKWIRAFGDPRADNVDPVVWVELIPFQETRKYVQRVLANYLVYRARMGDTDMTLTQALRRIPA